MVTTIAVNPFRCRVWHLHPRLDELITEDSCEEEIRSFETHRQLVPALGRYLPKGSDHDIEIICGARRLFVARHLKESLLVEVRDMTDKEAIIAIEMENGQRVDISPYERGMSYTRWLRDGYFSSQGEIASALGISPSQVSRLLKLACLPAEVVDAFGGGTAICEGWGVSLANAIEDPERALAIVQAARAISAISPRPLPREVYKQLCAIAAVSERRAVDQSRTVRSANGTPLFEIKRQSGAILVVLPIAHISAKALKAIEESLTLIIQPRAGAPVPRASDPLCQEAIA